MTDPKHLPVIAAIPNYNMGASLSELLPQVIKQGYDAVYVLDDGSTDISKEVVARFTPAVTWIGSMENTGASAARNRILSAHTSECIIHFLDADVRLETDDSAVKARRMMRDPRTAFAGGMIKNTKGKWHIWNYGPNSVSLYTVLTAHIQGFFGPLQAPKPLWRSVIRALTMRARSEWPDVAIPPKRRTVYWTLEGNLLVRRSVLERLGGFDQKIYEYDIIPPARKAYEAGMVNYFDPDIIVRHLAVKVRHYNRPVALYRELIVLIRRYGGWREFIRPGGSFKPGLRQ